MFTVVVSIVLTHHYAHANDSEHEERLQLEFRALFDPGTDDHDLPDLIRHVARAVLDRRAGLHQAARRIPYENALLLCDRLSSARVAPEVKAELASLLINHVNPFKFTTAFVPSMVELPDRSVAWRRGLRLRPQYAPALVRDVPRYPQLHRLLAHLPGPLLDVVDQVADEVGAGPVTVPYSPVELDHVRRRYPPPFDKVFPFNAIVARAVFDRIVEPRARLALCLPNDGVVLALLALGLRFDQLHLLRLGWRPASAELRYVLGLGRPERHLYHGLEVRPGAAPLLQAVVLDAAQARDQEGGAEFVRLFGAYLDDLFQTAGHVAFVRRRPDQVRALVSLLMRYRDVGQLERLAAQPWLGLPEFAGLVGDWFDDLLREPGRDPLLLTHLVSLPHLDLYRNGRLSLVILDDRLASFRGAAPFLQRLREAPDALQALYRGADSGLRRRLSTFLRPPSIENGIMERLRLSLRACSTSANALDSQQ